MDFTISTREHRAAVEAAAEALPKRTGILPALTLVRVDAHADGRITYRDRADLKFAIAGRCAPPGASASLAANFAGQATRSRSNVGGWPTHAVDGSYSALDPHTSRRGRLE